MDLVAELRSIKSIRIDNHRHTIPVSMGSTGDLSKSAFLCGSCYWEYNLGVNGVKDQFLTSIKGLKPGLTRKIYHYFLKKKVLSKIRIPNNLKVELGQYLTT